MLAEPRADAVAAAGVLMNGAIALLLYRSGGDVNIRSALLHEVGDTLSTAAVIVGGWYVSGHLGYVPEDPQTLEEKFVATNSGRPESYSFVAPVASSR